MRRCTSRAIQRLALGIALCGGVWVACELADRPAARADDVVPAVETSDGQPGGVSELVSAAAAPLDDVLDEVLPDEDTGSGGDPPGGEPTDDEPGPSTIPVRDTVEETIEEVEATVTPQTPEPADPDSSTQQPETDPPAPDPSTSAPADTPVAPVRAVDTSSDATTGTQGALFGGVGPARWVDELQTGGEPVCDRRGLPRPPRADRPGTMARGQLASPRGLAGPGPRPDPCQPDRPDTVSTLAAPAAAKHPVDPVSVATAARGWTIGLDTNPAGRTAGDDALPRSRLTLWPPGPG